VPVSYGPRSAVGPPWLSNATHIVKNDHSVLRNIRGGEDSGDKRFEHIRNNLLCFFCRLSCYPLYFDNCVFQEIPSYCIHATSTLYFEMYGQSLHPTVCVMYQFTVKKHTITIYNKRDVIITADHDRVVGYVSFPFLLPMLCVLYYVFELPDYKVHLRRLQTHFSSEVTLQQIYYELVNYLREHHIIIDITGVVFEQPTSSENMLNSAPDTSLSAVKKPRKKRVKGDVCD